MSSPQPPYQRIAPDVKLGKNVRIYDFTNLYGCEIDVAKRLLLAVPAQGGDTRALVTDIAFPPFGADWGPGGIVFVHRFAQGLWLLPEGGQPRPFAPLDRAAGESYLAYPQWLPDGRVLAVLTRDGQSGQSLVVVAEHRRTTLFDVNEGLLAWPVLADARSVVFERRGADSGLWKVDVSPDFSSSSAGPVPVFADGAYPSVSADGMLVSLSGVREGARQIAWVDRAGRTLSQFGRPQEVFRSWRSLRMGEPRPWGTGLPRWRDAPRGWWHVTGRCGCISRGPPSVCRPVTAALAPDGRVAPRPPGHRPAIASRMRRPPPIVGTSNGRERR